MPGTALIAPRGGQDGAEPLMDVEDSCAEILAVVERSYLSLRAVIESKKPPVPRGLLQALCIGILRNYRLLVRALRHCGYRGQLRGGRPQGWRPAVYAYEAIFRRDHVPLERLTRGLPASVARCLRSIDPEKLAASYARDELDRLSLLYSVPRWVVEKLVDAAGLERTRSILRAFQEEMPTYIRVNTRLTPRDEALAELRGAGATAHPDPILDDVVMVERMPPGLAPRLDPRRYYIQDRSAALVAHVLGPVRGTVLDSFSAPGGKAGHVAWRNPGVVLVALDLSRRRLRNEKKLLARQGVAERLVLVEADARKPPLTRIDAAIVDPDCSSIGRIGRSPETRLFLEQSGPRIVERLARLQVEGLRAAARLVRPGGIIVYSTCTLTLEENEGVVEKLVEEGLVEPLDSAPWIGERSPRLPRAQRVYPDTARCGGGFTARLTRL